VETIEVGDSLTMKPDNRNAADGNIPNAETRHFV
jgi:hypothetical protein